MKKIEIKNWRKYAFEFLSIFVAVISAFALNNWNDNRHNRNAENKILVEIYNGLEKDLTDIRTNKMGHERGVDAVNYFRNLLAKKPVSGDSLMFNYFNLTRDFVSIQNTSGYETLKSKGLEIIQNDSLRTKIVSLYEYDYNTVRKLEEEYFELQFQENYFKEINYLICENIEFDENKIITGIKTPLQIDPNKEKLLLTYLWKIEMNRIFILKYYVEVENKINQLRTEIKNEIEK